MRARPVIAILLASAASWAAFELTSLPGPGLDPDAMSYLGAAQSLAAGQGLRIPAAPWHTAASTAPLAHFPPGYPLVIAAGIRAGFTPVESARVIMALAAAVTAVGTLIALWSAWSAVGGVMAVLLLLVTPAMTVVHASVLSEPLFLALMALFLCAMMRAKRDAVRSWAMGTLAAAAIMVRYAGAALVLAAVLDAWLNDEPVKARVRRLLSVAALPVLAMAAWTLSRVRDPATESIRTSALYVAHWDRTITEGVTTARIWLAPGVESLPLATALALTAVAVLVALTVRSARATRTTEAQRRGGVLIRATALVGWSYVGVLLASRLFADGEIPLDERLLAPLGLTMTIGASQMITEWIRGGHAWRSVFVTALAIGWMLGASVPTRVWLEEYRGDGGDLASTRWRTSALVHYARTHADTLYSNEMSAIWFHSARAVHELPLRPDAATIAAFRAKLARENGALLAWEFGDTENAAVDAIVKGAGLAAVMHDSTGTVWKVPVVSQARP